MTDQQHPTSDDELLSAYLDGELTGDELARAERLLAEEPSRRQLVDELRQMGDELRKLPRTPLGDGFPERVLRSAERRLLAESALSASRPNKRQARWRHMRALVYAGVSLAAGLLIALVSWPPRLEQREVPVPLALHDRELDQLARLESAPAEQRSSSPMLSQPGTAGGVAGSRAAPAPVEALTLLAHDKALRQALARRGLDAYAGQIEREMLDEQTKLPAAADVSIWLCEARPEAVAHQQFKRVLSEHGLRVVQRERFASQAPAGAAASDLVTPPMTVLVAGNRQQLEAAIAELRGMPGFVQQLVSLGRHKIQSLGEQERPEPATGENASAARLSTATRRAAGKPASSATEEPMAKRAQPIAKAEQPTRMGFEAADQPTVIALFILQWRPVPATAPSPGAPSSAAKANPE